ncbi:MAG: hypothetical protein Q7U06_02120 [Pseudomonadota bacterium]|nr:hypothetical protein [Pseudomonadota bacterium]
MFVLAAAVAFTGPAHAGLRADLDRQLAGAPELTVVCSSASEALARVQQASTLIGGLMGGGDAEAPGETGGGVAALAEGVSPADVMPFLDGIQAAFTPDARLAVSWWKDTETLELGFDTTLDAQALARRFAMLDPKAAGTVFEGPLGWGIREADGDEMGVTVKDGWARVTHGPTAERQARNLRPAMLAAIPEAPGCVVAMHVADDKLGAVDLAAHLSFTEGQPATFVASLPGLQASDAILLEGAVPPVVTTPEPPLAVMVVGIGLDSVDFSSFLKGKELRDARRVQNLFPVTGGTTVALLQMEPMPRIAAVIPFAGRMPARKVARRTRRLATLAELDVTRIDATHLTISAGNLDILATARDNRLDLSTDPGALNAMHLASSSPGGAAVGEPWVSGAVAELAASWPLVFTTRILPAGGGVPARVLPRPLYVALDLEDALLKGVIDVPLPLAEIAALAKGLDAARKAAGAASDPPALDGGTGARD